MINPVSLSTRIFSILGNNSSLVPLGLKDVSNSLGLTAGSYITGNKVEGKDRFIDEFGTLAIWLLGIPFYKKVIDKTVYKIAGFNPNIDTRLLKDPDIFQRAKAHAPEEIKAGFEKIEKNKTLFKGLFLGKFIAATALTMGAYSLLTSKRHKHTEKELRKEIKREERAKKFTEAFMANQATVQNAKPSFKGLNLASTLQQFMFDPVKNTMIIDGGITTERLVDARNPQDFMGYVIKEGSFWAFMYFAGAAIQKHIEKSSAKKGKPIDLDIRVLQDPNFQKSFADKSIEKHLAAFSTQGNDAQIYESLFHQSDNLVVQMAKKADIIKTFKGSDNIDSQHYIDLEEIKGGTKKLGIKTKIQNLYKEFSKSGKNADEFFKEIVKLKRLSVLKNIGACIGVLGIITPGIMVAYRFMNKDNKEFQVKKEIKEKMRQNKEIS